MSGLKHICELLGAPEPEDASQVAEMVRNDFQLTIVYLGQVLSEIGQV